MSETKERRAIGRRGFLGLAALGVAVVAGKKIVDEADRSRHDLSDPEVFRQFVGREATTGYFNGKVFVREGATIHSRPTYYREGKKEFPFTTATGGDTKIALVDGGDEFIVNRPLLIFQDALEGADDYYTKEIVLPDGTSKKIYTPGSWICFGVGLAQNMPQEIKRDIEASEYKVACVNFSNLAFQTEGSNKPQFSFPEDAISY